MARANDYTVILNTKLDISQIQKDLAALQKQLESKSIDFSKLDNAVVINKTSEATKDLTKQTGELSNKSKKLAKDTDDLYLSFQEANLIMQKSLDTISAMIDQVFELDDAITEFRKVSDLSGSALDNYIDKLSTMGQEVARTGKPKCLSRNVRMVNVH